MSQWTYLLGTILVEPLGNTQPQKQYILETVLAHLPAVTGSEGPLSVHVIPSAGYTSSCSCNEFGEPMRFRPQQGKTLMYTQDHYLLAVEGNFRDRELPQTVREFAKWLTRLAKRVIVVQVLVSIEDDCGGSYLFRDSDRYRQMFEYPSWRDERGGEPTWCEYLMWEPEENGWFPKLLAQKYRMAHRSKMEQASGQVRRIAK